MRSMRERAKQWQWKMLLLLLLLLTAVVSVCLGLLHSAAAQIRPEAS